MPIHYKRAMLAGASIAFIVFSSALLSSTPATAGPLAITPKANLGLPSLSEQVQYRRGVRQGRVQHVRRYSGGRVYTSRRGVSPVLPAAVFGLFAGALGAGVFGGSYYCDPAYYSWNYGGGCRGAYRPTYYSGGFYPAYYPAYSRGYYPAYRSRQVIYRTNVQRPRAVRYRTVAPRRHYVGSRTNVRQGYTVRRVRR
ncbi:MAG: hypothetical protein Q8M31_23425 [Beijerinckiaceae bacterium]|nr:hypothetical protein [Beijerinckiaceae bacterium]